MSPHSYKRRKKKIVELLIKHGADVNAKNWAGNTCLMAAPAVQIGKSPQSLYADARRGKEKIVELLIKHGVDVNAKNKGNFTAVKIARENGYEGIVKKLIAAGAKE